MCIPGAAQKGEAANMKLQIELQKQAKNMARGAYVEIAAPKPPACSTGKHREFGWNARGNAAWPEITATRTAHLRMSDVGARTTNGSGLAGFKCQFRIFSSHLNIV